MLTDFNKTLFIGALNALETHKERLEALLHDLNIEIDSLKHDYYANIPDKEQKS